MTKYIKYMRNSATLSNNKQERALLFTTDRSFAEATRYLWNNKPFELAGWHCLIVPHDVASDLLKRFRKEVKEIELVDVDELPEKEALKVHLQRFEK